MILSRAPRKKVRATVKYHDCVSTLARHDNAKREGRIYSCALGAGMRRARTIDWRMVARKTPQSIFKTIPATHAHYTVD